MEELSHYKSLRSKYSKELMQSSSEANPESRPQTADKHVSFDFSEQMNIQELRNLREKKEIELERLSVYSGNEEVDEEARQREKDEKKRRKKERKEKRRKRKEKKQKVVVEFEVMIKPAIEVEFFVERKLSEIESSGQNFKSLKSLKSLKNSKIKEIKLESSQRSLYSENSISSKKSLVEEIEEAYKQAKEALENSFKVDEASGNEKSEVSSVRSSRADDRVSQPSRNKNQSFGSENLRYRDKGTKLENELNDSKKSGNLKSEKSLVGKNEDNSKAEINASFHSNSSQRQGDKFSHKSGTSGVYQESEGHQKSISLHDAYAKENSIRSKKSNSDVQENSFHSKNSSKVSIKAEANDKFSSYSKAGIFNNLVENKINKLYPVEASIYSDNDDDKMKEESLKSSVDFTISDPTPFQSAKFSQEVSHDFQQYFNNFKKGVFIRILSPIIQHMAEDGEKDEVSPKSQKTQKSQKSHKSQGAFDEKLNIENMKKEEADNKIEEKSENELSYSESHDINNESISRAIKNSISKKSEDDLKEAPVKVKSFDRRIEGNNYNIEEPEFKRKTCFEDFSEHSPKGSENMKQYEKLQDIDLRTSRSQPLGRIEDESISGSHKSFEFPFKNPDFPANHHTNNSNEDLVYQKNCENLEIEKATLIFSSLSKAQITLLAQASWASFFLIKSISDYKKSKLEKVKLAQANYEFNLLQKVISEWKNSAKTEKILGSRNYLQYVERWNFVKLYHSFEGLKFVTKAHKQWICEVRKKFSYNKLNGIFRNFALLIRYKKVRNLIKLKNIKKSIEGWKNLIKRKVEMNKKACIHWYIRRIFLGFNNWNEFLMKKREKWIKKVKADRKYFERLYTKVFLCWKHWKALESANYIPLRICTKTIIMKKNGNLQERSLLDIKIIKN